MTTLILFKLTRPKTHVTNTTIRTPSALMRQLSTRGASPLSQPHLSGPFDGSDTSPLGRVNSRLPFTVQIFFAASKENSTLFSIGTLIFAHAAPLVTVFMGFTLFFFLGLYFGASNAEFVFGGGFLALAVMVFSGKDALNSLISLICLMAFASANFLAAKLEFFAFTFLIVYVGAVAILFLFVIMLLNFREVILSAIRRSWEQTGTALAAGVFWPRAENAASDFFSFQAASSLKKAGAWTGLLTTVQSYTGSHDIYAYASALYSDFAVLFANIVSTLGTAMLGAIILAVASLLQRLLAAILAGGQARVEMGIFPFDSRAFYDSKTGEFFPEKLPQPTGTDEKGLPTWEYYMWSAFLDHRGYVRRNWHWIEKKYKEQLYESRGILRKSTIAFRDIKTPADLRKFFILPETSLWLPSYPPVPARFLNNLLFFSGLAFLIEGFFFLKADFITLEIKTIYGYLVYIYLPLHAWLCGVSYRFLKEIRSGLPYGWFCLAAFISLTYFLAIHTLTLETYLGAVRLQATSAFFFDTKYKDLVDVISCGKHLSLHIKPTLEAAHEAVKSYFSSRLEKSLSDLAISHAEPEINARLRIAARELWHENFPSYAYDHVAQIFHTKGPFRAMISAEVIHTGQVEWFIENIGRLSYANSGSTDITTVFGFRIVQSAGALRRVWKKARSIARGFYANIASVFSRAWSAYENKIASDIAAGIPTLNTKWQNVNKKLYHLRHRKHARIQLYRKFRNVHFGTPPEIIDKLTKKPTKAYKLPVVAPGLSKHVQHLGSLWAHSRKSWEQIRNKTRKLWGAEPDHSLAQALLEYRAARTWKDFYRGRRWAIQITRDRAEKAGINLKKDFSEAIEVFVPIVQTFKLFTANKFIPLDKEYPSHRYNEAVFRWIWDRASSVTFNKRTSPLGHNFQSFVDWQDTARRLLFTNDDVLSNERDSNAAASAELRRRRQRIALFVSFFVLPGLVAALIDGLTYLNSVVVPRVKARIAARAPIGVISTVAFARISEIAKPFFDLSYTHRARDLTSSILTWISYTLGLDGARRLFLVFVKKALIFFIKSSFRIKNVGFYFVKKTKFIWQYFRFLSPFLGCFKAVYRACRHIFYKLFSKTGHFCVIALPTVLDIILVVSFTFVLGFIGLSIFLKRSFAFFWWNIFAPVYSLVSDFFSRLSFFLQAHEFTTPRGRFLALDNLRKRAFGFADKYRHVFRSRFVCAPAVLALFFASTRHFFVTFFFSLIALVSSSPNFFRHVISQTWSFFAQRRFDVRSTPKTRSRLPSLVVFMRLGFIYVLDILRPFRSYFTILFALGVFLFEI